MGLFDRITKRTEGKRTGIVGAIFAVVTLVSSARTLKTYMETRKKKK